MIDPRSGDVLGRTTLGVDKIMDFDPSERDAISLVRLDADPFTSAIDAFQIVSGPTAGAGFGWIENDSPNHAFLHLNIDDDLAPEFTLEITGTFASITAADFVL